MKRYIRSSSPYIPDMTERFPEGLNGPDMYAERTPEDVFWGNVEKAEQYEQNNSSSAPNRVVFYWVSYWLQSGDQTGCTIAVPQGVGEYGYIEGKLMEHHGNDYGDIADYDSMGTADLLQSKGDSALYATEDGEYLITDDESFFDGSIDASSPEEAIEIFNETSVEGSSNIDETDGESFVVDYDLSKLDWKREEQRRLARELADEEDAYDLEHGEGIYSE